MNLVRRAAMQGAGLSLSDFDRALDAMYGGQPSYTGKLVSQQTALAVSKVWSCIHVVSQDLATLPLLTYRSTDSGRERAKDHYLWSLLQDEANPELTAHRLKALLQTWMMLWGNAYAEIQISGRGQVVALWPWRPDRVTPSRAEDGRLQYTYKMSNGRPFTLPQDRILHLRGGMGIDGVTGLSPIETHKQTIGLSMAITEHGARFFSNGARPLGILKHPGKLGDKAYENLKARWTGDHQGLDNAHRVAILEEGMDWKESGANMVDAQYIEANGMTQEDIASVFNVPQHRVGLLGRSTNNNISQQSLEYVLYTMMPLCSNWQSEIHFSLLSKRELQSISTRFLFTNLLRGDYEAMRNFIACVRQWGIMTGDEIREDLLDKNPLPDGAGKYTWRPVNMADDDGTTVNQSPEKTPAMQIVQPPQSKPNGKPNGLATQ